MQERHLCWRSELLEFAGNENSFADFHLEHDPLSGSSTSAIASYDETDSRRTVGDENCPSILVLIGTNQTDEL